MNNYMKTIISGLKQWVSSQKSDWNQNDSSAANFIKNRPFYSKEEEKIVFSGDVPVENLGDNVYGSKNLTASSSFIVGQIYKITFDNIEYLCECKLFENGVVFLGNLMIMGQGEETGEPFLIIQPDSSVFFLCCLIEGTHSLSISGTVEEVHQIDKKYIPMPKLADVAYSGSYNDLYDKPEIPTGVVHYNKQQSLLEFEKERARENIEALSINNTQSFNGGIFYIGANNCTYARIPKYASNYVEISSDNCKTWTSIELASYSSGTTWVGAVIGFKSKEVIFLDSQGKFYIYDISSNTIRTAYIGSIENVSPCKAIVKCNNRIYVLSKDNDAVFVSQSYDLSFTRLSLPSSEDWGYLYSTDSYLVLIPKSGTKTIFINSSNSIVEAEIPQSGTWLEPICYFYGGGGGATIEIISKEETNKYFSSKFGSWQENTLPKKIEPLCFLNPYCIIPKNGQDLYYYYDVGTIDKFWKSGKGMNFIGESFPTSAEQFNVIKNNRSNGYFLPPIGVKGTLYFGESFDFHRKIIWSKNILSDGAYDYNSTLVDGIEPFLLDKGYSKTLATTSTKGLMSSSDKAKLDNTVQNLKDGKTVGSMRSVNADAETDTYSLGRDSVALGERTSASGLCSFASGNGAKASGRYSCAQGSAVTAASECQHVQGKNNVIDSNGKYLHIVGNGSDTTASNAHTLDWDGNAWFAGNIYIGGTSQDDATAVKVAIVPFPTASDEGKILRVVNGAPTWVSIQGAEGGSF